MIAKKKILLVGANGYIGSRFYDLLNHKYEILGIDSGLRRSPVHANNFSVVDYRELDTEFLSHFTDCVWLAGHSSVPQSLSDPWGCFQNNLVGLVAFQRKFLGRLIYASSGSVYNNMDACMCNEEYASAAALNIYDFTKITFDNYLKLLTIDDAKKWVGLRFGTVVGSSKNIRKELLLNKMVLDSINNKVLNLANPNVLRPVLFIDDLVRALDQILSDSEVGREIFNLCSITACMSEYATHVSEYLQVPINNLPDSTTYNFGMSAKKFSSRYNFTFTSNIEDIIANIESGYTRI